MIEEQGIIIDIKGNKAFIKTEKGSSCESCAAQKMCHGSIDTSEVIIEADNAINAKLGDRVVIMVATATLLKAGFVLYMVPIVALITGVVIGQIAANRFTIGLNADILSGILGILFLISAFFGIKLYSKLLEKREGYRPVVVKVVG